MIARNLGSVLGRNYYGVTGLYFDFIIVESPGPKYEVSSKRHTKIDGRDPIRTLHPDKFRSIIAALHFCSQADRPPMGQ